MLSKVALCTVERGEEGLDRSLVGFLRSSCRVNYLTDQGNTTVASWDYLLSKARLIHAIVNVMIRPLVDAFNVLLPVLGEKINLLVFFRYNIVEFSVEHADYFTRLQQPKA